MKDTFEFFMTDQELRVHISSEEALHILELTGRAVNSRDLAELAQKVLPILVRVMGVAAAFLYFEEPGASSHSFFQVEVQSIFVPIIKRICVGHFHQIPIQAEFQPLLLSLVPQETAQVALFLLHDKGKRLGLLGLLLPEPRQLPELKLIEKINFLLTQFITQLVKRLDYENRIAKFNAYFTVSSKIAKAMNLRDVLEAVLYSSMEAVSAEAASVMLLDDEKKNFQFFGCVPPQPAITNAIFPADLGLAGKVLQSQRAEVINDVQSDPRFYKRFDLETGFQTRTMVAIPLVAGKEKIGVLEVLNKSGGQPFQEEDRLLLQSIAEEIAFAIHDAKLFDAKQALTAEIEKMHHFQTKLIQTSNDGIIANDPHGNIIIFNEGAERILGYRKEEAIGKINVGRLYPPGVAQEVRAKINSPQYGGVGRLFHYEFEALSKTGEQIPVELSAILIYENDREVATVGFFRDLRERKQLQEKLLQAERLAALGHMAAHISHEVKNPLMIIGGLARRVLKESAADQQLNVNRLKIIVEEIKRLEDFLLEVGSFARLSGAKKATVNLNALIQEMALQLEASLHENNIELSLNLDPQLPEVQFDPLHFRQVLLNIAKNSIEAMPSGGYLTFASGCHHDSVYVQVSDTGEGIPPDILDKIFDPFYSTKPKGSGLGLAISKTIIEAHQGKIKVENLAGQGTRVMILLKAKS
jgi:two-component system NtrC family sensor kinase